MAEIKIIPTRTTLNVTGTQIEIFNEYWPDDVPPDILSSEVKEDTGVVSNGPFQEGDLVMNIKNYPFRTNVLLSSNGDLIIDSPESNFYSINDSGELIYDDGDN
jgi:hypothetical protein